MAFVSTPETNLKVMLSQFMPSLFLKPEEYSKVIPIGEKFTFLLAESGYFHIQATKPDTVGKFVISQIKLFLELKGCAVLFRSELRGSM